MLLSLYSKCRQYGFALSWEIRVPALFYIDIPALIRQKGAKVAQTLVIGRITADLEMKTSANGNPYVRFDLVENIGNKENSRPQYFQICAWSDDAKRIVKARVKKGSLIWVSGSLELETFTKRDGITTDKRLKILLDNWGFIPAHASKERPRSAEQTSPEPPAPPKASEIDGDREPLPV